MLVTESGNGARLADRENLNMSTKLFNENKDLLLELASGLNYWGKRLGSVKLEVAETLVVELDLIDFDLNPEKLVKWLDKNKPTKPVAAEKTVKAVSNKPAANTMAGNERAQAAQLPVKTGKSFIITTAQNNTKVSSIFSQLIDISQDLGAELVVMPTRYNTKAFSPAMESETEYFDPAVAPFLVDSDLWLVEENAVKLAVSASVLCTAKKPVNAAKQLNTGENVTVVSGTKQQLLTLPSLNGDTIKEGWVTGACTCYNYTDTRAGREAESDHIFGALLVEVLDDNTISTTNLVQGDDGSILFYSQATGEYYGIDPVAVLGDLHCEVYDPKNWKKTLIWLGVVAPSLIVVHDILHFATKSHHNRNDAKHLYLTKNDTVERDLAQVINQLNELTAIAPVYIVESNHNSAIDNWLHDQSVKIGYDAHNKRLFHLLNWLVCDSLDSGSDANALQIALENTDLANLPELNEGIEWGRMDKTALCYGVDISQHGHKGQNGSQGNHNQISQWRLDMVTGHTHSPAISGSLLTVGVTARMDQGYNRGGASSWQQSHGLIHRNKTKQIVCMNTQAF